MSKKEKVKVKVKERKRKRKGKGKIIRAFKMLCYANENKILKVLEVQKQYIPAVKLSVQKIIEDFFKNHKLSRFYNFHFKTKLSERFRQNAQRQALWIVSGWVNLLKIRFSEIANSLDGTKRKMLLFINSKNAWYEKEIEIKGKKVKVPEDVLFLSKSIFRRCLSEISRPKFSGDFMLLDKRVASVE